MKRRYQNRDQQQMYESMLTLAADKTSELYQNGQPRRAAGHRAAFSDGYSGEFTLRGRNVRRMRRRAPSRPRVSWRDENSADASGKQSNE